MICNVARPAPTSPIFKSLNAVKFFIYWDIPSLVVGRKYLSLNPVTGTVDHEQMSLSCCPLPLYQFQGVQEQRPIDSSH
jgi:hypothetical protein